MFKLVSTSLCKGLTLAVAATATATATATGTATATATATMTATATAAATATATAMAGASAAATTRTTTTTTTSATRRGHYRQRLSTHIRWISKGGGSEWQGQPSEKSVQERQYSLSLANTKDVSPEHPQNTLASRRISLPFFPTSISISIFSLFIFLFLILSINLSIFLSLGIHIDCRYIDMEPRRWRYLDTFIVDISMCVNACITIYIHIYI